MRHCEVVPKYAVVRKCGRVRVYCVSEDSDKSFKAYELPRMRWLPVWMPDLRQRYARLQEECRAIVGGRRMKKSRITPRRNAVLQFVTGRCRYEEFPTRASAVQAANEWLKVELNGYILLSILDYTPRIAGVNVGWVE